WGRGAGRWRRGGGGRRRGRTLRGCSSARRSCCGGRRESIRLEQQLLEIEVALHAPHHGVVDGSLVAHPEQLTPLLHEQLPREPPVRGGDGLLAAIRDALRLTVQPARAMTVAVPRVR